MQIQMFIFKQQLVAGVSDNGLFHSQPGRSQQSSLVDAYFLIDCCPAFGYNYMAPLAMKL